jgi:hypothetical protein
MSIVMLVSGILIILVGARKVLRQRPKIAQEKEEMKYSSSKPQMFGERMFPTERIRGVAAAFGYVPAVIVLIAGLVIVGTGQNYMESLPELAILILVVGGVILAFGAMPLIGSWLIEKGKFEKGGSINMAYSVMCVFLLSSIPTSGLQGIARDAISTVSGAIGFVFLTSIFTMVSGLLAMFARTIAHR